MTIKKYLIIMSLMTAVCCLMWLYILWTVDPEATNWIGFVLFYSSLFVSLVGVFALAGFVARFVILKQGLAFRLVKEAFRQSFLFAVLVSASLFLLSKHLFSWLNLFLLVVSLSLLEFFWINYTERKVSSQTLNPKSKS